MKSLLTTSIFIFILSVGVTSPSYSSADARPPVQAAAHVDLAKFLGTWYEIAVIPYLWEYGCTETIANYSLRPDGQVTVLNSCRQKVLGGKRTSFRGVAWSNSAADPEKSNAKLLVAFFKPQSIFSGDYWILEVGENYEYAVTANPNRQYLWVLSRTPHMDEAKYQQIVQRAALQGFDVSRLVKTPQP